MYALIENGVVAQYPYSVTDLRRSNPDVSFPPYPDDAVLATFGVLPVVFTTPPVFDPATQRLVELTPVFTQRWEQAWEVVQLTPEEIQAADQAKLDQTKAARAAAYVAESDPIFFKSQRGEATHEEWLAKVDEIRARYP